MAQNNSDLYLYVDSLIKYNLKFRPEAIKQYDTVIKKIDTSFHGIREQGTLFPSFPLIIANGHLIEMDKLNKATLADTKNINAFKDATATALYGSMGVYGVIIISGKKKLTRKILRN